MTTALGARGTAAHAAMPARNPGTPLDLGVLTRTRINRRRFSVRSLPTNPATNASTGCASKSSGAANCTRLPELRIAMRSPILIASSMSWLTNRIVLRSFCCMRRNWSWIASRFTGSSAANGSSISSTGGSTASARATPTRCACPPESSFG